MRHSFATLAAVLVAGCATATPVARPEPIIEWAPPPPLTARLYEAGHNGFVFDVSDAAFVAIFEIVPNAGASIVYPSRPGQYNYVSGGGMRVAPSIISPVGRWMYVSGFRSYWEPTYYYLVASRRPLALGALLTRVGGVRQVLGWRQFVTGSPYVTMDRLAEAVLPETGLPEDDWTDDLLVVFPPPPVRYATLTSWPSASLAVQCVDGRHHFAYALPVTCFNRGVLTSRPKAPPPDAPPAGGDSASAPAPGGTPEPPKKDADEQRPERTPPGRVREPRKVMVIADEVRGGSPTDRLTRAALDARTAHRRSGRVAIDGQSWSAGGPAVTRRPYPYGADRRRRGGFEPEEVNSARAAREARAERAARASGEGSSGRTPSSAIPSSSGSGGSSKGGSSGGAPGGTPGGTRKKPQ